MYISILSCAHVENVHVMYTIINHGLYPVWCMSGSMHDDTTGRHSLNMVLSTIWASKKIRTLLCMAKEKNIFIPICKQPNEIC